MLQPTPTNCTQRPCCAPGSSPPAGVSQGHFNSTPHSRMGLALIPNYNTRTIPPGESPTPSLWNRRPISAGGPHPCPTAGRYFERLYRLVYYPCNQHPTFPHVWPHSHGFGNHFSEGHPSFNYSSLSTLNSEVTYRPLTEKVSALC
ncbi:unnamed protein product [Microthlaspi erraticum]|uniref:Uncharacterized protein n=1 Tax=Microthlaspi erraticum TaxID=1685480 RepID=A0A6D2JSH7_9BRAS|nr:unnamed protein product [Microthlaspi erraticum]